MVLANLISQEITIISLKILCISNQLTRYSSAEENVVEGETQAYKKAEAQSKCKASDICNVDTVFKLQSVFYLLSLR